MIPSAVEPEVARAAIARCWLEGGTVPPLESGIQNEQSSLGAITLLPHQVEATRLLRACLAESGGAVLADEVGMGKTFVALALAREAARPVVVAPAGLRPMWRQAGERAGVNVRQVSTEALSRTGHPEAAVRSPDLVIVDEAHHFRNPATRRYRALARLTAGARVLLVTATPIHNRAGDLAALLGLFLGAGAWTMSDDDRARFVVRRGHAQNRQVGAAGSAAPNTMALAVPAIDGPHPLPIVDDEDTLRALVALPAPIPPSDGGDGGTLVAITLARQWASSGGALRGALRRRRERAAALAAGLESGAHPSYRDLREWCVGEGAVQLAFPEMLVPADPASASLLPAVRVHAAAIRELLDTLASKPDPDEARAERLRSVVRSHEGQRVVAFSAYEDTVRALYRRLRSSVRVCALGAQGAVVAGGRISRWEAMAQFAPGYHTPRGGAATVDRIDLLLTTDLLSEGVNLQCASVVVHLDLPWTPARLEQRVGRVARMGSNHSRVHVYALTPPASSEALLGIERHLRAKLAAAGRSVGIAGSIVPVFVTGVGLAAGDASHSGRQIGPPEQLAHARAILGHWLDGCARPTLPGPNSAVYAAVRSPTDGFLAACTDGGGGPRTLIASFAGRVSDAPADIAAAVRMAEGEPVPHDRERCQAALRALHEWWGCRRAASDAGLAGVSGARVRLRVLARIAAITHRAPRHVRPRLAALVAGARRAALTRCGIGAETVLGQLAEASMPDGAWLRAVGAFGEAYSAGRFGAPELGVTLTVVGLILFVRE